MIRSSLYWTAEFAAALALMLSPFAWAWLAYGFGLH